MIDDDHTRDRKGHADHGHERRQFGRRAHHSLGRVKLPGRPSLPCQIKNISDGGALLVFDRAVTLPFGFLLNVEGDAATYGCEVRHHYGERVGVAFVDPALISDHIRDAWIRPKSTSSIVRS